MNNLSPSTKAAQLEILARAAAVIESMPVTRACCNCLYFCPTAGCSEFGEMPPADYHQGENGCERWSEEVPF